MNELDWDEIYGFCVPVGTKPQLKTLNTLKKKSDSQEESFE